MMEMFELNEGQANQITDLLFQNKNERFEIIQNQKFGNYYAINDRQSYFLYLISIDDGNNSFCPDKLQQAKNYVELIQGCNSLYIAKVYDSFSINQYYVILFEDCVFPFTNYKHFQRDQFLEFAEQMIDIIIYLHSKNIFLKSFSLQKIFLSNSFQLKITDIAVPKHINCQTEKRKYEQDDKSGIYLAPEILEKSTSNQSQKLLFKTIEQEIWSYGVWLLIISDYKFNQVKDLTEGLEKYPLNTDLDFDINQVISLILQKDPEKRPTLQKVKEYLRQLKKDIYEQNIQIIQQDSYQFELVKQKFLEKEFVESFEIVQELVFKNPFNDEYLSWMGRMCYALGKYDESEYFCYQANKINKNNDLAYFILGINNAHNDFLELAKIYYQKAISINPNNILALNNLGLAFQQTNEFRLSLLNYQKALRINPNDVEVLNNQGTLYYKFDQYKQSIYCFKQALKINNLHSSSYYNLGMIYLKLENYNKAINYFEYLIKMKPSDSQALFQLGFSYKKVQQYQKSLKYLQLALSLQPNKAKYLVSVGQIYMELLIKQTSFPYFEQSLSLKPRSPKYNIYLGIYYLVFEPEKALSFFIHQQQQFQNNQKINNYLGICYYQKNQLGSALESFQKAHLINKRNKFVVMNKNIVKKLIMKEQMILNHQKIIKKKYEQAKQKSKQY